jgi:uncharacterized protein YuzE
MHFQIGDSDMKINYYPETDSLYIDLSSKPSVDSVEVSEGVVIDYDAKGQIVGIDIDNAGLKLDLKELVLNKLPIQSQILST